jgi:hypothetical protein
MWVKDRAAPERATPHRESSFTSKTDFSDPRKIRSRWESPDCCLRQRTAPHTKKPCDMSYPEFLKRKFKKGGRGVSPQKLFLSLLLAAGGGEQKR